MKLTVLTENTANKRGVLGEHGLSVLIEAQGKKLLFDTGQSGVYAHNAKRLGVRLDDIDAVILSHGHYDHAGGLEEFPDTLPPVYVRREALEDKLCKNADRVSFRQIGIPWVSHENGEPKAPGRIGDRLHFTGEKEEIFPDISCWGRSRREGSFRCSGSRRQRGLCRTGWRMNSFWSCGKRQGFPYLQAAPMRAS